MSGPPDLSVFQNAFYIGNNFNAILYGMELVLYFMTIRVVMSRKHAHVPSDKYFLIFSTILLLLNTVFVATEALFGEEMWIVNKNYPGGQDAYLNDFANVWYQTFGTASSIVLNLLSDGLLIYRCYIVWDDVRIIIFPTIVYLGSFSLGIAQLVVSGAPAGNYFKGLAKNLGIGYTSSIIGLETLVTILICGRIVYVGRKYRQAMGKDVGRAYTNAAAIIVESMMLSTLTGIAYIVPFARGDEINIFFLSIYVMMTCISPQLVVLRVMSGRAWTRDRSSMLGSRLEFTDRSTTRVERTEHSPTSEKGSAGMFGSDSASSFKQIRVDVEEGPSYPASPITPV